MNFTESISSGLEQYASFEGRSTRSEFWYWVLFQTVVSIILGIADAIAGSNGFLRLVGALALLLPSLAVTVRRYHDTGRSGLWYLLALGYVPMTALVVVIDYRLYTQGAEANLSGLAPWVGLSLMFGMAMQPATVLLARRHGRFESWQWLAAFPILGLFLPIVFLFEPSDPKVNRWGV